MILLGTGRGTASRRLRVEGRLRLSMRSKVRINRACPSTILRMVLLPLKGRMA